MATHAQGPDHQVVIIGSGFAGLGMAIRLRQAGCRDFVVLEKADEVGGTWRDNTYPGCACDVQSHMYSFSFEPNPSWSRMFAEQPEIWEYLRRCVDRYDLRGNIRFGAEVTGCAFDETAGIWHVSLADGRSLTARVVVAGLGPLHVPAFPDVPGLDRFRGVTFHSSRWNHDYDLTGKRVAVIGTGASAIQFVPRIAARVGQLHLFQRTPPWIMPKPDRVMSAVERRLFRRLPFVQRLYRNAIYWQLESRILGFNVDKRLVRAAEALSKRHIARQIPDDPALRAAVTPTYTLGCKRVLISDDYYPALTRPNVELVTDGIREVREHSVVTADGVEREVDAIIHGTGFRVGDVSSLDIVGAGGVELNDLWRREGMQAHLGVAIAGFPNLFMLVGPNSGLGHNSIVFMIEAQARYVVECLRLLDERRAQWMAVRPSVQDDFNRKVQGRLNRSVWQSGCESWYLDDQGVNRTLWPGFTFTYWLRTRRVREADYDLVTRASATPLDPLFGDRPAVVGHPELVGAGGR
ncbi:flavin-containing monooxygenase [Streptoalloteichus hindustanus]|uniref:Predicted flavoprotein CzcO associated with the cation diffusion facilitator CzcD n=1 Tax=Streptoalloteichus hindustanus TaxID=2017 RepID=A0A1M4YJN7_STRHI|nr:NAD(P)/FAD-dependent oxidoreductase [Streptoalloteichus hindustanus]SHF05868.1 Predicted flavoprotein CzcO associated with the cation diffusion facilitator CzcD [Streptoalloteichus hindustanus]